MVKKFIRKTTILLFKNAADIKAKNEKNNFHIVNYRKQRKQLRGIKNGKHKKIEV